jgi:hypothetical protein
VSVIITILITVLIAVPAHVALFLLTHRLIAAALAVPAYVVLCLAHPVHKCPRCRGARVVKKGNSHPMCRWCKGQGKTKRLGGHLVHRVFWDHVGPWIRDKYLDAAHRLRDGQS